VLRTLLNTLNNTKVSFHTCLPASRFLSSSCLPFYSILE
jgi:hypothetical protein